MGYAAVRTLTKWVDVESIGKVHEKPNKWHGSIKALPDSMEPTARKDGLCILYNEMMSIYLWVSQI